MKVGSIVAVLALAAVSSCAMAQTVVREYHTNVKLNVDTRGQVAKVGTPAKLPAMLVPSVRKAVAQWRFKAPVVHGSAVSTTTWAYIDVQVVQQADKHYGVRVVYNGNGPKVTRKYAPSYPARARRAHAQGDIQLQARVELDGTVDHVHVVHSEGPSIGTLARAAKKAMRHWHALPMRLDGKPVVTHVQETIHFVLHTCRMRCLPESATQSPPTKDDSKPAWARMPSGQVVATDSPLHRVPASVHKPAMSSAVSG